MKLKGIEYPENSGQYYRRYNSRWYRLVSQIPNREFEINRTNPLHRLLNDKVLRMYWRYQRRLENKVNEINR